MHSTVLPNAPMTKPLSVVRPYFKCLCCSHEWRPLRAEKPPLACPKCRRTDWDTGRGAKTATGMRKAPSAPLEAPKPFSPPPDPYLRLRQDVRSEYAAFLARRDAQDAVNRREHVERVGQRRYAPEEGETADVRPPVKEDGVPFWLARLTLTRRKHRAKGK
jgi:hypothetical protein